MSNQKLNKNITILQYRKKCIIYKKIKFLIVNMQISSIWISKM